MRPGCNVICKSFAVLFAMPYFGEGKANKFDSNLLYLCNVYKKNEITVIFTNTPRMWCGVKFVFHFTNPDTL